MALVAPVIALTDTRKVNRPSFTGAAPPDLAESSYRVCKELVVAGIRVARGGSGARMVLTLVQRRTRDLGPRRGLLMTVFSATVLRPLACLATLATAATVLSIVATAAPAACKPTLGGTPGPFTRLDAPRRSKIGTGHILNGRVLRAGDCAPVAGAVVFLWQAGPNGYGPRGRGSVRTDRLGRFRFQGPVPASYGGLPHIHIAVIHPAYEELLTRYVVRRGAKSGRITVVLAPLL